METLTDQVYCYPIKSEKLRMNSSDHTYLKLPAVALRSSFFIIYFLLFTVLSAMAQPQVVNFKQLQQFLPQGNFGNYLPEKPSGETSTMMGFSTSWAQVDYRSLTDSSAMSVKITDLLNIPSYMSVAPSMNSDTLRATPVGYEKIVMYKNLKIMETYDSTSHQAKLQAYFANRFLLELNGRGISKPEILYGLLDKINFDGLSKSITGNEK